MSAAAVDGSSSRSDLAGRWTGIGSMPGDDARESSRIVVGETPLLPALPELPARGPGADMVGRTAALLEGIAIGIVPTGWRVVDRPGGDLRRARSWLGQDLDAFEEVCTGRTGPVKVQVVGPWTLAAGIELANGESLLRDHGARRDLVGTLAEAVHRHVIDVRRRMPDGTTVVVQIDEPLADRVLRGLVPTASGWATYRSLDRAEVRDGIGAAVSAARDAGAVVITHSCAAEPPLEVFLDAGVDGLSFDLSLVTTAGLDTIAAAVEAGVVLLPGVVDGAAPELSGVMDTVGRVQRWWGAMGFSSLSPAAMTMTPTCGLAGTAPTAVTAVLQHLAEVAKALEEDPDGDHVDR